MGIDLERRDFAPSDWEEDPMDQPVSELGGALTRGQCEAVASALCETDELDLAAAFEEWARGR